MSLDGLCAAIRGKNAASARHPGVRLRHRRGRRSFLPSFFSKTYTTVASPGAKHFFTFGVFACVLKIAIPPDGFLKIRTTVASRFWKYFLAFGLFGRVLKIAIPPRRPCHRLPSLDVLEWELGDIGKGGYTRLALSFGLMSLTAMTVSRPRLSENLMAYCRLSRLPSSSRAASSSGWNQYSSSTFFESPPAK